MDSSYIFSCMITSLMYVGLFMSSFFLILKSLRRIGINSSLNVWQNSLVKHSGPECFFFEILLVADSISLLVSGLLKFPISS